MSTETTTGGDLKQMREMCGLSQYELARLVGIPRNRISLAECGYVALRGAELSTIHHTLRQESERRAAKLKGVLSSQEAVAV